MNPRRKKLRHSTKPLRKGYLKNDGRRKSTGCIKFAGETFRALKQHHQQNRKKDHKDRKKIKRKKLVILIPPEYKRQYGQDNERSKCRQPEYFINSPNNCKTVNINQSGQYPEQEQAGTEDKKQLACFYKHAGSISLVVPVNPPGVSISSK